MKKVTVKTGAAVKSAVSPATKVGSKTKVVKAAAIKPQPVINRSIPKAQTATVSVPGKKGNATKKLVVNSLSDIGKLEVLLSVDYNKMLADLYKYFRELKDSKNAGVVNKRTYIRYKDYRISFTPTGVKILDEKKYNLEVPHKLKGYPEPKVIAEFIDNIGIGISKEALKEARAKKTVLVNQFLQRMVKIAAGKEELTSKTIKGLFAQFKNDTSIEQSVRDMYAKKLTDRYPYLLEKSTIDLAKLRERAIKRVVKSTDADTLIKSLIEYIPNKTFNCRFRKLKRAFEAKQLRFGKLKELLLNLLKDDDSFTIGDKRKAPDKFIPMPEFVITEIIAEDAETLTFKNKVGTHQHSKSEILAQYLLHTDPHINVAMCKLMDGVITPKQFLDTPTIRDRFTVMSYSKIRNSKFDKMLFDTLIKYCENEQLWTPFDIAYLNERNVPLLIDIEVQHKDLCCWFKGRCIKSDGGYKMRYEDGTVKPLFKHQAIRVLPLNN